MNILIPHNWLLEYCKTDLSPREIAERVSVCGVSVEKLERVPAGLVNGTEYVYDIEVTTNRPDMMSLWGVAREVAAILKKEYVLPEIPPIPKITHPIPLKITIDNADLCPRYLGIILQDIEVKPSPGFISERLTLAGARPINNVVDITNYVMLEYGQPLHAFDVNLLARDKQGVIEIIVRKAKDGEEITTLDKQHFALKPEMLVIADSKEPIALAGIKGGVKAEVTSNTKTIVLECANFNPSSIRKTSKALALQTDASVRFDKGLAPLGLEVPFGRAIDLLQKFAQATPLSQPIDAYPQKAKPKEIIFHHSTTERVLGAEIPFPETGRILSSLGFSVSGQGKRLTVGVPPWRYNDISQEEDLVEEVARIYGYERLDGKLLDTAIPAEPRPWEFLSEDKAKDVLVSLGFSEVYTYSFVNKELLQKVGFPPKRHLQVANPLSEEFRYLRRKLWPSLLEVVEKNQKRFGEIKIFELAHIYTGKTIPYEQRRLAGLIFRKKGKLDLFYELKGVLENLFSKVGIQNYQFRAGHSRFFHREASSEIEICGRRVGIFGLVERYPLANFSIKEKVFVFDLDFEALLPFISSHKKYTPIPRYPAVERDVSMIVSQDTLWQEIQKQVRGVDDLIKKVALFDVYQGKQIGASKKSLAFRITYRSEKRSLREEEVNKVHGQVLAKLKSKFGAKIREK